jgi:hypothetical protein
VTLLKITIFQWMAVVTGRLAGIRPSADGLAESSDPLKIMQKTIFGPAPQTLQGCHKFSRNRDAQFKTGEAAGKKDSM